MTDTIRAAKGVGLAAPQVGVSRMLILMDWSNIDEEGGEIKAYINPEIVRKGTEIVTDQEGCLSLPEVWADVDRPKEISISYKNVDGEIIEEDLDGMAARVFQHELDHLLGILFIDRITARDRVLLREQLKAILDGRIQPFNGSEEN